MIPSRAADTLRHSRTPPHSRQVAGNKSGRPSTEIALALAGIVHGDRCETQIRTKFLKRVPVPAHNAENKVTTMATQKKSVIGKRQSVKKALVAKRVSADASKAEQVKAPFFLQPLATKKK